MDSISSKLSSWLWPNSDAIATVPVVGLDDVGKTTLLKRMRLGEITTHVPLIGI